MQTITLPSTLKGKNCLEVETAMGLNRGQVASITASPDGTITAQVADSVATSENSETAAMTTVATLIDGINNLADAKVFLKRLCKRLIRNGVLP